MKQEGYFLILAVIFILVIGLMGTVIAHLFANRAQLSVAQQNGLTAFYMAESGYEIGSRLLTLPALSGTPSRLACSSVTGHAQTTNSNLNVGTFTITTINSSPIFATSTLSEALTSSSSTINLTSASGFASRGRVMIDNEIIDYTAVLSNSLVGITRAANGTVASSHAINAPIGQYQCMLDVGAFIPNASTSNYKRELEWSVQLQEGWLVGNNAGSNFVFSHWNRPTELNWTSSNISGGSNTTDLNSISLLSYADGWAVGNVDNGHFILLHWDGSSWQLSVLSGACGTQDLFGVSMVSSQEAWAVGGRYRPNCINIGPRRFTVMQWSGSSWNLLTPSSSPSIPADATANQDLNAVHVIDTDGDGLGNIGFAVGNNGEILQYNGSNWVANASPVSNDLNGVFTVSSTEAWAVGGGGRILHWNGSSWSIVSSPTSVALHAITMLDSNGDGVADSGWAVGNSGTILAYNGTTWTLSADVGSRNLLAVSIVNANDAWVVGNVGEVHHWDGSSWTQIDIGVSQALNGISMIPSKTKPTSGWLQVYH
ncbi:MAG: hypothetical protein A3F42_07280 [Gammaproteobacteria bacterium RIFCSPHIGHO2_12_FULL_37_34]|nr:MAG: hypothetical protein A3F42_07280 [Gammaproteobacteria bacterium RIFCSPHIGHO2_12_FULL_37_34]